MIKRMSKICTEKSSKYADMLWIYLKSKYAVIFSVFVKNFGKKYKIFGKKIQKVKIL